MLDPDRMNPMLDQCMHTQMVDPILDPDCSSPMLDHARIRIWVDQNRGVTNWPKTIQRLGSDDIASLGIKSFATEGVGTKNCSGYSRWIWISKNDEQQKSI